MDRALAVSEMDARSVSPVINRLPTFTLLFVALWVAGFIYCIWLSYFRGPTKDDWDILPFIKAAHEGQLSWAILFEQYYSIHRVAISRLLIWLEFSRFHGTNVFPNIFAFVMISASFVLVVKNIFLTSLGETKKYLLVIMATLVVFNTAHLAVFNYTWHSFQRPPGIFVALLCLHFLARDFRLQRDVGVLRALGYFALVLIANFFTVIGLFVACAVMLGLLQIRAPRMTIAVYGLAMLCLFYYSIPGEMVFNVGDDSFVLTQEAFLAQANVEPKAFFPHYFTFLFAYAGGLVTMLSYPLGIGMGVLLLGLLAVIVFKELWRPNPETFFFQLIVCMLVAHALATALGRYQIPVELFNRFYSVYCWLIISFIVLLFIHYRRLAMVLAPLLVVILLLNQVAQLNYKLQDKMQAELANVNIINGNYIHFAYKKISLPHMIIEYNPVEYFDKYLRENQWGLYHDEPSLPSTYAATEQCEAYRQSQFMVSDKRFVEYKLDGWNLTQNKPIENLFALNRNGEVIARGQSVLRAVSYRPLSQQARENVQLYMVLPTAYRLRDVELVGNTNTGYCKIALKRVKKK